MAYSSFSEDIKPGPLHPAQLLSSRVRNLKRPRQSRTHEASPINKLTHDVLGYIFSLNHFHYDDQENTSPHLFKWHHRSRDQESSLTHMRYVSQVCKGWRDLTIESPFLWAHALNLRLLNQKKDDWRKEVIKRTGNAPLSVRGVVNWFGEPSTTFLLSLLENQSTRIRILNLDIHDEKAAMDSRWQILHRPSPNLEIFRVFFHHRMSIPKEISLFSDCSPRLHYFVGDILTLDPSISASWTGRIRTFVVSSDLHFGQILAAIDNMPLLEVLAIYSRAPMNWDIIGPDLPLPKPPLLKLLKIKSNYKNVACLLHQMALPSGCQLSVNVHNRSYSSLTTNELSLVYTSLARQLSNFVGVHRIAWTFQSRLCVLSGENSSNTEPCFRVRGDPYPDNVAYAIPLAFSMSDVAKNVTELAIDLGGFDSIDTSNQNLLAFVRSLKSVETLSTESDTLQHLIQILDNVPGSFPRLKTVVLESSPSHHLKVDVIMRFLMRRRDAGLPISIFDLRECRSPGQEKLLFLEGMDEISVLWDPEIRTRIDGAYRDWTNVDSDG